MEENVREIALDLISPSRMNTFRDYPEGLYEELKASIQNSGLLMPIIVRPAECCETYRICTEFEIIAGEHRYMACKDLGTGSIRCEICRADDVTASVMIGQTNIQREASEIDTAWNYRNSYELMKKKRGGDHRSGAFRECEKQSIHDENFVSGKDRTIDTIAAMYGISSATMYRKIRLTELTDEILEKYLKGKLTQEQAVQLSFGDEDAQRFLIREFYSSTNSSWIDDERARAFGKKAREMDGRIPPQMIRAVMRNEEACGVCGGRSKDRRYPVPTSLFPKELKLRERPQYIEKALMYIKTNNIKLG